MTQDPYATLGVKKTASEAEIKKAYRKQARKHHPDLNPGDTKAEKRFKAVSSAYDLLKNSETRTRFDHGEIDATGAEKQPERKFYREYAEQPGHSYQSSRGYEDFGDMSDIFADILRQRGQAGRGPDGQGYSDQRGGNFKARGGDARFMLEIGFLDAVKGGSKRITLPTGEALEVKIPEGTRDGQTIRLRGKGGEGAGGGARGDALVTISVRAHKFFTREEYDIKLVLPITLDEAVLGGKVPTPTIDGSVNLTIPKGASSGQMLRLRGKGIKHTGKKTHGDQMVELRIVAPPKIDESLHDFMEGWRKTHAYDPRKGMKS